MKSSKNIALAVGEDYVTVTKTYVLIRPNNYLSDMNKTSKKSKSPVASQKSIYTSTPISFIFDQFFAIPDYYEHLDKIYNLNNTRNEVIFLEYMKEKFKKIIMETKLHNIYQLCWEIFLLSMYDRDLN